MIRLETPILFIIFNRPDKTRIVFDEIKKVKPKKLFVAADGPRDKIPGEVERCEAAREIVKNIDWNCELKTLFRDRNLGLKMACSTAIDWFFENVEKGIILEDDVVPQYPFFRFCQELLEYYQNDTRIMQISGNNFQAGQIRGDGSYYFSKFVHEWGQATWRRAWKYFDINLKTYPKFVKQNIIANVFSNKRVQKYWLKQLDSVDKKHIDAWSYIWFYSIWRQNGLSIIPNVNLISNIGWGRNSTHTRKPYYLTSENREIKNLEIQEIKFPLRHPSEVLPDSEADKFTAKNRYNIRPLIIRAKNRFKRILLQKIQKIRSS